MGGLLSGVADAVEWIEGIGVGCEEEVGLSAIVIGECEDDSVGVLSSCQMAKGILLMRLGWRWCMSILLWMSVGWLLWREAWLLIWTR